MKRLLAIIPILILLNSCAVIESLLGWNKCAKEGCDREAVDNCNYCGFHCDSYYPPEDFNKKVGKSIDDQVKRSQKNHNQNKSFK